MNVITDLPLSNDNRTGWIPIRLVIITIDKYIVSTEHESNLFSQIMVTDRIGPHKVLLRIYYKNYNF